MEYTVALVVVGLVLVIVMVSIIRGG